MERAPNLRRLTADSTSLLAALVESSDDAIYSNDLDGLVVTWNGAAERMFGYRADEMIGRPVSVIIPPELNQEKIIIDRLKRGEKVYHYETVRLAKDGRPVEVSLSIAAIRDCDGELIGVSKIARDITDRKHASAELEHAARLRLIVEAAPSGMVMVDQYGVIILVNAQMERLFGYPREEMLGATIEKLLPERYRGSHSSLREEFYQTPLVRAMGRGRDLYARRKDGSEFPVEIGLNPADTPEGPVVLAAVVDITERKRNEEALSQALDQLGSRAQTLEAMVAERTTHLEQTMQELEGISYGLSHDLRAPLRTIHSFSQIVLIEASDRLLHREIDLLQKTTASADKMDRLIQDCLAFNRVARAKFKTGTVDLDKLVRQIVTERAEFQPPRAVLEIEGALQPVLGDEGYLTQCITNVLDNAVKFVQPGRQPRIRIWSEMRDRSVRTWFEDNGIGVPENAKERIFGIFQRVHKDGYPGTGIGLAIARKAVERMGGRIGIESNSEQGSRFWVELEQT